MKIGVEQKHQTMTILFGDGIVARRSHPVHRLLAVLAVILALGLGAVAQGWQKARLEKTHTQPIPAAQFSRIIQDFSEEGGFFLSDNFITNETSYLHVLGKLRELGATGGAYIGVGPEQNFTYIAKIRPRIAFIVDIRRQAMIQQLMYKAIFHLSENRTQFLARLFSKPLPRKGAPGPNASLPELLMYLDEQPGTREAFAENLALVEKTIEKDFRFSLSARDKSMLKYVFGAFGEDHLNIQFRFGGRGGGRLAFQWGRFPTFGEILLEKDLQGEFGNFLAKENDYKFVRDLHRRNRIIPIVGDFAGSKALAAVGNYLKKEGYSVTAFYTSNVEQFLFGGGVFGDFVENVRKLPITEHSLFIRAFTGGQFSHPARVPGHRLTTVLEKITVFLQDYDQNLYPDYWALINTHFISGRE